MGSEFFLTVGEVESNLLFHGSTGKNQQKSKDGVIWKINSSNSGHCLFFVNKIRCFYSCGTKNLQNYVYIQSIFLIIHQYCLSYIYRNVRWVHWNGKVVVVISLLATAKISLCFGRRNGVVPVTASPFQWLHVIFYCIDIPMIWHVLYLYHFMLKKIMSESESESESESIFDSSFDSEHRCWVI